MRVDIVAETVIRCPRERVAAFASDPQNDPVWIGGVTHSQTITDQPFGVGSKVTRVAVFLLETVHYTTEVVEYEPGALIAMSASQPSPMAIRYEFADADGGGTKMSIRVQGEGRGLVKLMGPVLGIGVRRRASKELDRLKELLGADSS